MTGAAMHEGSGLEKFNLFLDAFLALSREQGGDEFVIIMITFIAQGGVRKFAEYGISTEQLGADYHRALNVIFAQGQAEGAFQSGIDPNLMTTFFFSFINGLMLMYPLQWKDLPVELIREALLRLLGGK